MGKSSVLYLETTEPFIPHLLWPSLLDLAQQSVLVGEEKNTDAKGEELRECSPHFHS